MSVAIVTMRIQNGQEVYLYRDVDNPQTLTVGDASVYLNQSQTQTAGIGTNITNLAPVNTGNTISVDDFLTTYGSSA